ncbi:alpha/beta fold hydrolase [Fluviispira vulneris]|uniref:alpha/beta fold hydrolase n=1 Tax=Fluviispira vulneris TaxID=2763012 RepID=UPI0016471D07|nr:alpha/beta hydrolase [Fluviispira vulneris]
METFCSFFQGKNGKIHYFDNKINKKILLFIHGLSVCKEVFYQQVELLKNDYRIIAVDLLGHGASENALYAEAAYSSSGFADSIIELLCYLKVQNITIYGWSLGGAIAIDILERFPETKKIIIDGYPPVSYITKNFESAYKYHETTHLIAQRDLSEIESIEYAKKGGIIANENHSNERVDKIVKAVLRSNGEMKEIWFNSLLKFSGISPKECVERHRDKVTLLIGEKDPGINLNYIKDHFKDITVFYPDAGHAVFWEKPYEIRKYL